MKCYVFTFTYRCVPSTFHHESGLRIETNFIPWRTLLWT